MPAWARWTAVAICGLFALSGGVFLVLAFVADAKPVFTMAGFELMTLVSGVIGVLVGLGRFKEGPALALAMIAGAVLSGTVLGYLAAAGKRDFLNPTGTLGNVPLGLWLHGRVLASLVLAAVAAVIVLIRDRRSWMLLARGIACGVPVLVMAALAYTGKLGNFGSGAGTGTWGAGEVLLIVGALVGAVLAIVLTAASGHYLIRAFEVTREPPTPTTA